MGNCNIAIRPISPDWLAIRLLPNPQAADALQAILAALDGTEEAIERFQDARFSTRGIALLAIKERGLWQGRADSMGDWIKKIAPRSWSYCYSALGTIETLKADVPVDDLKAMPRCNLIEMKDFSTAVRKDPKVIEAAKTKRHDEFIAQVAKDHPMQHIELKSRLEEAIQMCMAIEGCGRKAAENAVGELYISEYAVTYAQLVPEEA